MRGSMLPKGRETPRGLQLQAKVDDCHPGAFANWPNLSQADLTLVGAYIVLFSYIDLNLRRMAETLELAGDLPCQVKSGVAALTITDVEKLLLRAEWAPPNRKALEDIQELRQFRNLLAHFAIKRFPEDDAFLFMTKSARDYRREFGQEAPPGALLTAVVEVEQVRAVIPRLQGLDSWLATAAAELDRYYSRTG
jgi:hypothetical protein